jgi:hypothetical protein
VSGFDDRLASWFRDRRWRVMTELNGGVTMAGTTVTYARGAFEIAPPGVYVTPLGSRGRRGYVIIETDGDGNDIPGTGTAFGEAALRRASAAWGTITGLPAADGAEEG